MEGTLRTAHVTGHSNRELRSVYRRTRALRVLLVAAIVESLIHYTDNTVRYDDYSAPDPSVVGSLVTRWMIPISWVLFTVAAVIGYRRFRQHRWPQAAAWIGVYSVSGLVSVFHFVDISPSELTAFQNTFVWLDILLGVLLLGFAVWTACRPPTLRRN
jgi:hypothetical protein